MITPAERRFVEELRAAEMHWFFVQGSQAARAELWLASVVALLTGIENSVRVTVRQLEGQDLTGDAEVGATLSNSLLRRAKENGMPISKLAFPGEQDFDSKLSGRTPHVEIVRARHNLCHGNILEWLNKDLGPDGAFFTPECVRPLAEVLLEISSRWAAALGDFRTAKRL